MGPADVVRSALAAAERDQWRAVASVITTDSLRAIQQDQVGMFASLPRLNSQPPTSGGTLVAITSGPLTPESAQQKLTWFPGAPQLGELAALAPEEFFVRWQEAGSTVRGPRWERAAAAILRLLTTHHKAPEERQVVVLGEVLENDHLAHVLYRMPGSVLQEADVISVVRENGDWRMEMSSRFARMPFTARASMMAFASRRPSLGAFLWRLAVGLWRRFSPHRVL